MSAELTPRTDDGLLARYPRKKSRREVTYTKNGVTRTVLAPPAREEEWLEWHICDQLRRQGCKPASQVRIRCGVIDILTTTTIYEVKYRFGRSDVQRGIGQLLTYSVEVPNRRLILIAGGHGQGSNLGYHAARFGVDMHIWWEGDEVPV